MQFILCKGQKEISLLHLIALSVNAPFQEKAKAIALGLDAVVDTTGSDDPSGKVTVEDAEGTPIDTETHLTVDTSIIKVKYLTS